MGRLMVALVASQGRPLEGVYETGTTRAPETAMALSMADWTGAGSETSACAAGAAVARVRKKRAPFINLITGGW
jgi:hypothetical protein